MFTQSGREVGAKCNTMSTAGEKVCHSDRKKHHGAIRNMITASSHMLYGSPEGYMALGSILFLQEQIKDIIITGAQVVAIVACC